MRLTAQTTIHAPNLALNPVEHFECVGPEILDEEDYAPLAEIEHALEDSGTEEAGESWPDLIRH
jgi:hypothetical protein